MTWFRKFKNKVDSDLREKDIVGAIFAIKNKISCISDNFSHREQLRILNTVTVDFIKEKESRIDILTQEVREIREILKNVDGLQ